jgi:LuxR family maltose regulon positive regulatory protein
MSTLHAETQENALGNLLRAKLHRPRATRDLVARPRLLARLNRGLDGPLILVCAPAGFGKTTLISSWLGGLAAAGEGTAPQAAWLSLDEQDGDLVTFLRYFLAALRALFPGAGSETLALLRAAQSIPLEHLSAMLSNEIEILPRSFVLVLDDYHLLEGRAVHDLLDHLVRHWPRPLHLVLISRVDPPLALASLRARGKIAEIRTADLRFSAEEAAAYLAQVLDRPLRPQDLDLLQQHTEGWIAALQLAGLSLRTPGKIESIPSALATTEQSLAGYLQGEVLARQVPAIQTFLLKTSVLDRFCTPLCEAVVGDGDPAWGVRGCMEWIDRADLFVTSLDDRREWYRYHPLFRDFLKEMLLERSGPAAAADLHRRAAAWFAQQGLLDEAVRHAQESGDLDLAASLIEGKLRDLLNREDRAVLEHWLGMLPERVVERRPWLLMLKAWALQSTWQLGLQSKVVSQLEALLEEGGGAGLPANEVRLLRGQIRELQGQYAYLSNQLARSVACCEEALELVPRDWTYVRGGAIVYWGMSMGASGQTLEAERELLDRYESLDDRTTGYALRILQALCFNYLNAGQLEPARQTANVMLQQALRGGLAVLQGWARLFLGLVSYQWNELDAAGVHLAELVDQRYLIQSLAAHHGLMLLASVRQARGESAEAWRLAEILSQFQLEQGGREEDELRSLRARLMLEQGNLEGACRWADAFTAPVPDRPLFWAEIPHLTRARILLERNGPDDVLRALHILDDLLDVAGRTHNTRCKIPILTLRAWALDAQGNAGQAMVVLQEAVDLSRPGGFLRPFVDLGPRVLELLGRLAGQSSHAEPVRRILAAFSGAGLGGKAGGTQGPLDRSDQPAIGVPALVEPLTARELEILMLLREPVWPKEIARRLDISYLTVKRHTANLYGKLGVNTRWDAVSRAAELGVLPPR